MTCRRLHLRQHGVYPGCDNLALDALHFPTDVQRVAKPVDGKRLHRALRRSFVLDAPTQFVGSAEVRIFAQHHHLVFGVMGGAEDAFSCPSFQVNVKQIGVVHVYFFSLVRHKDTKFN